ncbi:pyridine nucleotide-disulfide oxidoreductase [Paraburkholderia steynii]|uniref:Pyridine nucleotide-disulfide oxidoreductase n=1 Tax=Paraburkholderia steynii TaxID=1245441 RepID=A0A4R0XBX9_9BURK|nr:pyridine nucleotide-disulfide oxidoreductase [Paraburkholderia steynii]
MEQTTDRHDVLIVGAGQAGSRAAMALRQLGFNGTIALLGDEPEPPYSRPPLSKEYLSGSAEFEKMLLRPANYWAEKRIGLHTGRRAVAVDAARHFVRLEDGATWHYGRLIWATGGAARRLSCPGNDLPDVHTVRTHSDVDKILSTLHAVSRIVIVGGGFIGLETAAVMKKLGKSVVLVEGQDRVMARVCGATLSRFYEKAHRENGVDIRLGAGVAGIEEESGTVVRVHLSSGESVAADIVIVGIGIEPAVEPLIEAGAESGNGVTVDAYCQTSLPDVFAIGDCASHSNRYAEGARVRVESVQNANGMALTVAKRVMGAAEPYDVLPWFWSNQFDLRLQTAGLCSGFDQEVLRGDPATRAFSVAYMKNGRLIAMNCVNSPRDFVQAKAIISEGGQVSVDVLSDSDRALTNHAARAVQESGDRFRY